LASAFFSSFFSGAFVSAFVSAGPAEPPPPPINKSPMFLPCNALANKLGQ